MPQLCLRGKFIGSVKAILFDKDGTLVDSEKRLIALSQLRVKEAINVYKKISNSASAISKLKQFLYSAYGFSPQGIKANGSMAIASRSDNLISTATVFSILGESWPKSLLLANQVFLAVDNILDSSSKPSHASQLLPGAEKLLQSLKSSGIYLGLISNDTKEGISKFLRINNLEEVFDSFWSAEHYPPKPSPDAAIGLCKTLGAKSSECALIGDADSDLLMARKSNIKIVLGYTAGWTSQPLLYEHDHLIHHWDELIIQ